MTPDLEQLRRSIDALARRERRLLLARATLGVALVVAVSLLFLAAAAGAGWDRGSAIAGLLALSGCGSWIAIAPMLRGWRRTADPLRQARILEARDPALDGRMIAAAHHLSGARGGESPALLSLVARRAAQRIAGVGPDEVHGAARERRLAAVGFVAWVMAAIAVCLAPGGPIGVFGYLGRSGAAQAAVDVGAGVDAEAARVGDIMLRYVYPDHTRLDPVVVPNSTGDAHGPRGTVVEVLVKSAAPIETAHLVAYDGAPLEAEVVDHREIRGTFVIGEAEGTWHLVLRGEGEPTRTRDFKITPEPDLPPDVQLTADEEPVRIPADGQETLPWTARDDYGIVRVMLEIDGVERPMPVRAPDTAAVTLEGDLVLSARDLALPVGTVFTVVIAAWDNDGVSGSKVGRSAEIRVVIGDEVVRDLRREQRREALLETLLDLLADHLEDPWPPGRTDREMASWGEVVAGRYAALDDVIDEYWEDMPEWVEDREVVELVVRSARELIRYTQVSFTPGSNDVPPDAAFLVTSDLRDAAIVAVEDAITYLDSVRRAENWADVLEAVQDAKTMARRIEGALSRENVDPLDLLTQMDFLESLLRDVERRAARLESSALREMVNQRASELQALLQEAREALARGDIEDAREMLARLARAIDQMAQAIQEEIDRQTGGEQGAMREARELADEIRRLEQEERALQAETAAARQQRDAAGATRAEELWERAERLAEALEEKATAYREGVDGAERSFNERERVAALEDAAAQLRQAVEARDLQGARAESVATRRDVEGAAMAYEREARARGGSLPGPGRPEMGEIGSGVDQIQLLLERLTQQDQGSEEGGALQQLAERQQQLEEQLRSAASKAQEVARGFPTPMRGLEESLDGAQEQMGRARQSLDRGQAMSAEGSEGVAAERLAEAGRAIEDAMQRAAQASQARQGSGGEPQEGESGREPGGDEGEQEDAEDRGGQNNQNAQVAIPAPEEFQTPEEYRQALLEGMEGDVPEEYRALKRRYYEELVSP